MRTSSPTLDRRRDEALALDELLERVEELGDAYGTELLNAIEPWIERAREAASNNASDRVLRDVRDGIEQCLLTAACQRADELVAEYGSRIDELVARAGLFGSQPGEIAAVIIDAQSPDVPAALCGRPWPVSVERRDVLASELESSAPNTAAALRARRTNGGQHDVVVVTIGRVLRTTRASPAYGDA